MHQIDQTMLVMKILSNAHRFAIMHTLFTRKEELCVNQLAEAVGISQSLASQQLSYLHAHGVIEGHRYGQTICYVPSKSSLTDKIRKVHKVLM